MKTPDEIKKGLACCTAPMLAHDDCPYKEDRQPFEVICKDRLMEDALADIQLVEGQAVDVNKMAEQLEYKLAVLLNYVTGGRYSKTSYTIEEMKSFVDDYRQSDCETCDELEYVKRERDAAVSDLEMVYHEGICKACANYGRDEAYNERRCLLEWDECRFEWRGMGDD